MWTDDGLHFYYDPKYFSSCLPNPCLGSNGRPLLVYLLRFRSGRCQARDNRVTVLRIPAPLIAWVDTMRMMSVLIPARPPSNRPTHGWSSDVLQAWRDWDEEEKQHYPHTFSIFPSISSFIAPSSRKNHRPPADEESSATVSSSSGIAREALQCMARHQQPFYYPHSTPPLRWHPTMFGGYCESLSVSVPSETYGFSHQH